MVLASIWFFFWAKNGGFIFKKGDWDEYKSTVLRRKGPNGTTLSGATKTTKLGGGSVVADADDDDEKGAWKRGVQKHEGKGGGGKNGEKWRRGNKNNDDADMRAYRHEKPARVGGLNREADGVVGREYAAAYGDTGTVYSDDLTPSTISGSAAGYVPINTPRQKAPRSNNHSKPTVKATDPTTPTPKKNRHSHIYASPASNGSTDSHRPLRPNGAQPGSGASTPTRTPRHIQQMRGSRNGGGSMPGSFYNEPADWERGYMGSETGTEDSRGTKAYFHPIPGLTKGNGGGFRRGGGGGYGRGGGSLSDSE